jgi:large subunit ribosomal protein L4
MATTADLYSAAGDKSGSVPLPEALLAERVHEHAIWETVKNHLANQRQGTHKTRTRHEVSGQKSKLYRQKGTGRARAGSATSGTRVGGGRIHGPRPRDYSYRVPAQVRRLALRSALADRAASQSLLVIEDLRLEAPRTRTLAQVLARMGLAGRKVLFVSRDADPNLVLSCRNLPQADVTHAGELNAYRVLQSETVVLTRGGLAALEEVLAR